MVYRGVLKSGKTDDRITFLNNLIETPDVKFDLYGIGKFNLFGLITILKQFQMQKWD